MRWEGASVSEVVKVKAVPPAGSEAREVPRCAGLRQCSARAGKNVDGELVEAFVGQALLHYGVLVKIVDQE